MAPVRGTDDVRFCGVGVGNTAVEASADQIHLRITHTRGHSTRPVAVWELSMPPAYARYLAAVLDSHARYVQSAPTKE
ncbi:hypothetical protein CFN78_08505 [Amycolatopsis antarctica]|uniref:DUF3467 domain-containing protein n=1 Tax=Amycolatopsis antarctica TaxID=1854586 RepID=A0A263D8H5_9PSEU|nr:hypothetical protein CFN78_08505 [Amycolatopsis antarctica]